MLKSLLLPVETSGLYFQDYSVLNAERLHISFAGKPIWGSSKTEKLQGFPNKSALQKKKVSKGSPSTQIKAANMGERQSSGARDQPHCLGWAWSSLCGWHPWEMAFISAPFLC